MKRKVFALAKYKDDGNGSIEGYASTWIRQPDSYGEVVARGAFAETLKTRWNGGQGIPFLWSHKMDDLSAFIGKATAEEDEKGLHFIAAFDDTEEAQKVRQLYKDGRLRKFSFAYDVRKSGEITLENGAKAIELQELDLYEISAVTVPANDDAGIVDIKSGKRNSKADEEKLRQAITLIQQVLGQLDEEDDNGGEDDRSDNAGAEDRKGSNPEVAALLEYIDTMTN